MIDAAKKAGKFLMVGQNQRLDRAHRKAREIIQSGRLGRVLSFRTAFKHGGPDSWSIDSGPGTWFFKKEHAIMGVCGDLGIHKADLMRYLLGEDLTEVTAMIGTQHKTYADGRKIDVDDNAMILVRSASGVMGSIIISWTNYGEAEANYTFVYGEKGVMQLATDPQFGVIVRYANGDEERHKLGAMSTNERQVSSGVSAMFVDSILANTPPPIDGVEGYKSLDVILAAFESNAGGRAVRVGDGR
jgi:predicted dehydrogenase